MTERMTWKEIQEKHPDQWVGLIDVKYIDNDGISIESAVIKDQSPLSHMFFSTAVISCFGRESGF